MDATEAAVSILQSNVGSEELYHAAERHLLRVFKDAEPKPVVELCGVKHPYGHICANVKGHAGYHVTALPGRGNAFGWRNDADDLRAQQEPVKPDPPPSACYQG